MIDYSIPEMPRDSDMYRFAQMLRRGAASFVRDRGYLTTSIEITTVGSPRLFGRWFPRVVTVVYQFDLLGHFLGARIK